jgi:hypothetical protein
MIFFCAFALVSASDVMYKSCGFSGSVIALPEASASFFIDTIEARVLLASLFGGSVLFSVESRSGDSAAAQLYASEQRFIEAITLEVVTGSGDGVAGNRIVLRPTVSTTASSSFRTNSTIAVTVDTSVLLSTTGTGGLNGGAVAAIVILLLLIAGGGVAAAVWFVFKRRKQQQHIHGGVDDGKLFRRDKIAIDSGDESGGAALSSSGDEKGTMLKTVVAGHADVDVAAASAAANGDNEARPTSGFGNSAKISIGMIAMLALVVQTGLAAIANISPAPLCVGGVPSLVLVVTDPTLPLCGDGVCSAAEKLQCLCRGVDCDVCCVNRMCEAALGESLLNCAADCPFSSIINTKPAHGELSVSPARNIELTFARPIDTSNFDESAFSVRSAQSGQLLDGAIVVAPSRLSIAFLPSGSLTSADSISVSFDGASVLDSQSKLPIDADGGVRFIVFFFFFFFLYICVYIYM